MPATPIYFDNITLTDIAAMLRHANLELATDSQGRLCARSRPAQRGSDVVALVATNGCHKRAWPPTSGDAA